MFVDPSRELGTRVQGHLRNNSMPFEWISARFQDVDARQLKGRFDLVLAVNSWYYIGRDVTSLQKVRRSLRSGGRLIIVLVSEHSFGHVIQRQLRNPDDVYISVENISEWLHLLGCEHIFRRFHRPVPLSRFLDGGDFTREGEDWLAFLCGHEQPDEAAHNIARGILREQCTNGVLPYRFGLLEVELSNLPSNEDEGAP